MTAAPYSSLYKAVWHWKDDHLTYHVTEGREKATKAQGKQVTQESPADKVMIILDNVDQNQQKLFKQKFQRAPKQNAPNVITIQDIKDVVMFLTVSSIPRCAFEAFMSCEINNFLRTLIVYLQLYLQVKDDLVFRKASYDRQRLKHPISIVRESMCRRQLSRLRSRIGQEYALIIAGEGKFKRHHHMNNTIGRSYTAKDLELFDYLLKLSVRVAWIALYRSNYKEIEYEISRLLLNYKPAKEAISKGFLLEALQNENDRRVLYGDEVQVGSHWHKKSPVVSDLFLSEEITDLVHPCSCRSLQESEETHLSGLEAVLTLPEELLEKFKITVGILGQPRDNFEVMLHLKQVPLKTEEEELDYILGKIEEEEKPSVKMYQYLNDLETTVDLRTPSLSDASEIKNEILFYKCNHIEDSKKAYKLWLAAKFFCFR